MSGKLLTNRQAAELLAIHPNTLKRLGDRGDLPFYRVGTRGDRRYRRDQLLAYLEENTLRRRGPNIDRGPERWGDLT